MISGQFVHLIETHWQDIISRVINQIRREPAMPHFGALADAELRERGEDILEHLGHWLASGTHEDLQLRYERLGRLRFEQEIPLHESVHALCIIREKTLEYVEEHIASNSSAELYAEEQLERRLGRFFDLLTIHLVRGYERALRRAAAVPA